MIPAKPRRGVSNSGVTPRDPPTVGLWRAARADHAASPRIRMFRCPVTAGVVRLQQGEFRANACPTRHGVLNALAVEAEFVPEIGHCENRPRVQFLELLRLDQFR